MVLGFCLNNQVDGPSLLSHSVVSLLQMGEILRTAETLRWKHHTFQIPNLFLSPNPRPGLGSESSQQPYYPCMYTSLSLQGLEEILPNIDVTCKFPMPGRGDSTGTRRSMSWLV